MKKLIYQVQNYIAELNTDSVIDVFSVTSEDCDYKVVAEFALKVEALQFIKFDKKHRRSVKSLEYNGFKIFRVDVCLVQEVIIEIDEESGEREIIKWLDCDCPIEHKKIFNAELAEAAIKLRLHKFSSEWFDLVSEHKKEKMYEEAACYEYGEFTGYSFSKIDDETLCDAIWFSRGSKVLKAMDQEGHTAFETLMEKSGIEPSGDLEVDIDDAFMALGYEKK